MKAGVSPDCSYQLVSSVLAQAGRDSKVDVYIYSISAPHLMDLLRSATTRGASIRVMYDPDQMAKADAQTLVNMGLDVRVAPSHDPRRVFTVCHQKFVVIDRKTVLIESANWANTSIPFRKAGEPRKKGNREWLVRVDDNAVASWYADLFQADWDIPALPGSFGIEAAAPPVPVPSFRAPRGDTPRDFGIMTFSGQQMTARPLTSPDNYFDEVIPLIRTAANRIWIQQQYIEGAGGTAIPRLLETIKSRANDVDVRLIVSSKFPESWIASKDTVRGAGLIDKMRAINLDNFTHCHNKGVIVDDAVVISSTNWSENSVRRAREAGILVHSASVAGFFAQVFADDWRTGWSVATADANASTFDVSAATDADLVVDPADRV
jgi:phosphatidylserine/phosphatidylglycerophosphate/cardiolipin synthase-like enzyme